MNTIFRLRVCGIIVFLFSISCNTVKKNQQLTWKGIPEEFLGTFADDYGSVYEISNTLWVHDEKIKYHLISFNIDSLYLIARNDENNPTDKGLFTRIDIIRFSNMEPWKWGFCLTAYKASSIEEAEKTMAADRNNPRKGCNGFPFTRMKRRE